MPKIENIYLTTSVFVDSRISAAKLRYDLQLSSYEREKPKAVPRKKGFRFAVNASFDLMRGIEKPAMALFCNWRIEYSAPDKKEFEILSDPVILAHIVSYLREHVSNLTIKSRFSVLYLDTVNTFDLYKRYLASKAETASPGKIENGGKPQ